MNKLKLFVLLIVGVNIATANPNFVIGMKPKYDRHNNLITPDKILLAKAVKAYQEGYNQSAMTKFMQSAAFGNTQAQKYIGLMHIKALSVPQDWAKGYAWIKLAALDNSKEHIQLRDEIYSKLKEDELKRTEQEYQKIKDKYDQSASLKRRVRWVKKQSGQIVGSRAGSQTPNVVSQNSQGTKTDHNRTSKLNDMEAFVQEYNFGIVTAREIQTKD